MKRILRILSLILFPGIFLLGSITDVEANNSKVETLLAGYGDTSMFYQGLLNTGVINELREDQRYTIFAPTNEAFAAQINQQNYPCFYAPECRPQIAAVLRSHILQGTYPLQDLVTYGSGIQSASGKVIYVQEPYVGDYSVDGQKILSKGEMAGNIVYRVNGIIATPQDLSPFQTVSYTAPSAITTEKTTVRRTYYSPSASPESYPAGGMTVAPDADNTTQTTTVIRTYEAP